MMFLLVNALRTWLEAHGLGFLRVFVLYPSFQATMAILASFVTCVALGPGVIRWLVRQKIGDVPNVDQAEMNAKLQDKKGTPTMGGLLILAAIGLSTLLLADISNRYVQLALVCLVWLGAVGAADDWLKLTVARRNGSRQGLTSLEKLMFQIGLGLLVGYFTYQYGQAVDRSHTLYFPFFKHWEVPLRLGGFMFVSTLVLTGSSNAVNLTDGLDGLAAGTMTIVSFAFLLLALIAGSSAWAGYLYLPYIQASDQMAVIAGAIAGACLGFLWFNCNPAAVFMGDKGSLALGGLIGYISIVIRQELMLFMVGGIFVVEAMSVIIQVSYFKYTRRKYGEGRRVFLMSPLHHHFQRKGWTETQVVVRFWLIGAMLAAMALATVKLR
jgi:phospho-N-acetylmuramoyl-pentapeptide-transferase